MNEKEIINDFYNLIVKNIKENELNIDSDKVTSDSFFIGEKAVDSRLEYNITNDIKVIQSDLIYTTGILFSLRPYINNPLQESKVFMGKQRITYFQNMYDSLYSMYASFCFEKLYNFWDRIGDKIATEFTGEFPNPRAIMFGNVIEKIRNIRPNDNNIKWLTQFKDTEFKDFNEKRKIIVHYAQLETKFKEAIFDNMDDMTVIENIWNEKSTLPEFFKKHIEYSNEGIMNTYEFVKKNK